MLLDHFHPPLSLEFGWKGFHVQWAATITADLNERLPEGWRASSEVEFGVAIDVGVLESVHGKFRTNVPPAAGEPSPWSPPEPTRTLACDWLTDVVEIRVVNTAYSPVLVGAIELVSPANKDRPEHRDAFVAKCMAVLSAGAGLVVVDVVTDRLANLHAALLEKLEEDRLSPLSGPYVGAYRPVRSEVEPRSRLQIWHVPLAIGEPLPTVPLCLRVGPTLPLELDATYRRTCSQLRIPTEVRP